MLNINLLPWREEKLKLQKKNLRRMVICSIASVMLINGMIHYLLSLQDDRVQKNIDVLSEKLKEKKRIPSIQPVAFSPTTLFSELGKSHSQTTCFTEIKSLEQSYIFTGKARSIKDLTTFLLHWNAAYLFSSIHIKLMEQTENDGVRFELEAKK